MKRSDISDEHVLELTERRRREPGNPGVVHALVAEGVPEKVAFRKVMHMVDRGLMDYGVSPYYAWPVE